MTRALFIVLALALLAACGTSQRGEFEDLAQPGPPDFAMSDLPDLTVLPAQTSCNQTVADVCDDYFVMSGDILATIMQLNQACAENGNDNIVSSTPCMKMGYANAPSCAVTKDGVTDTTYVGPSSFTTAQDLQQTCMQSGGTFTMP
jgi:hypothetical protein